LGILHCLLYCGEGVNIRAPIIARPFPFSAIRRIVAKYQLQPRPEWQLFHNLAEAPAGDFGEPVAVARQPAGAV